MTWSGYSFTVLLSSIFPFPQKFQVSTDGFNTFKMSNDIEERQRREKKERKRAKKAAKEAAKLKVESTTNSEVTSATSGTDTPERKRKRDNDDKKERKKKKKEADTNGVEKVHVSVNTVASSAQVEKYYQDNAITITSTEPLTPVLSFSQLSVTDQLKEALSTFSNPTPIQACSWPVALAGKDVIGIAETGSGKTLAFGIPALHHIANAAINNKGLSVLVVSPTRELAMQSHETFEKICPPKCNSVCIYGGVSKEDQIRKLNKSSTRIAVGTPGRLLDLINDGSCDVSNVSYLVLDEADRMLDKGFEEDIKKIISATRQNQRQTLMFSATWPESVRKLANTFMTNPTRITIGSEDLAASVNVTQQVIVVEPYDKESKMLSLVSQHHKSGRVLLFALYKKEAARIEQTLQRKGYACQAIHGDLNQSQRSKALEDFKSGKVPLLVATDVAARGLDIPNVQLVVNVTFPLTIEDYVHRIGRTGRGGNKGTSITLFTPHDKGHSGELINVLKAANQDVPDALMKFGTTVKKKTHSLYGNHFIANGPDAPKNEKIVFDDD